MTAVVKMDERAFTKTVIEIARTHGWLVTHFLPNITAKGRHITAYLGDGKGFPDIVAVRERILFAELKIPPNRSTPEQTHWATRILATGCEIYLWTPDQLDDIQAVFAHRQKV